MANEWIDGFDLYPVGALDVDTGNPWGFADTTSGGDVPEIVTADAISGTRSLQVGSLAQIFTEAFVFRSFTASAEIVLGFAIKITGPTTSSDFRDQNMVTVVAVNDEFSMTFANNVISVWRGSTLIATGSTQLPTGSRQYVEAVLTNTTYAIYLNGVLELSGGITAMGNYSTVQIGYGQVTDPNTSDSAGTYLFDDIYLNNTSGERWGDTSVIALFPDADTVDADWTPTGVASGFQALDNVPPLTTEYIESTLAGDKSVFDLPALPANVFQIFTVHTQVRAEKTIAGATEISTGLIQNAVEVDGAPFPVNENTYTWHTQQFATDPDTGLAWNPNTFAPQLVLERTT